MNTMHSTSPPMCHGHLTSHNIFIERDPTDGVVKTLVADYEMLTFMKYANRFNNYRVASVWSCPEILGTPAKVNDPTREMDIYSYGLILWELLHDSIPFDNDLALAVKYVLTEDARPKINEDVDCEVAKIIRLCW